MKDNALKIDFIGIGAAKAGTTWLAEMLGQHPNIFIPKEKELSYFNKCDQLENGSNYRNELPLYWYHNFFKTAKSQQLKGEFSGIYLYCPDVAANIYQYNPKIKLIIILREPSERAFSHYLYFKQKWDCNLESFQAATEKYPIILRYGFYYQALKNYYQFFPKAQIKILFFEDLKTNSQMVYKQVLDFLQVEEWYPENLIQKTNITQEPRFKSLNSLISASRTFIHKNKLYSLLPLLKATGITPTAEFIRDKLNVKNFEHKPQLDPELKAELKQYFREDIEKLEQLLDKDLQHWK